MIFAINCGEKIYIHISVLALIMGQMSCKISAYQLSAKSPIPKIKGEIQQ